MRKRLAASICLAGGVMFPASALAAEHLDCMTAAFGGPEQALMDADIADPRGVDPRGVEIERIIDARAKTCMYTHGWSINATILAFKYGYIRHQYRKIEKVARFTPDQDERLSIAVEPDRKRLTDMHAADVTETLTGVEKPLGNDSQYRPFFPLLKKAAIPQTKGNETILILWLAMHGSTWAYEEAFLSY